MKYKRYLINAEVEAFTFDELKKKLWGKPEIELNGCIVKKGDKKYHIVSTRDKVFTMSDQDMLLFNGGLIYRCDILDFQRMYKPLEEGKDIHE